MSKTSSRRKSPIMRFVPVVVIALAVVVLAVAMYATKMNQDTRSPAYYKAPSAVRVAATPRPDPCAAVGPDGSCHSYSVCPRTNGYRIVTNCGGGGGSFSNVR